MIRQIKKSKAVTNRDSLSLTSYLNEVSKFNMLSPSEEAEIAEVIQKNDHRRQKYVDKLVNANLRFVVTVAKQYHRDNMLLQDLIEEGNIGLIKAANNFDPTRGFKFISYAVWWIRQSILAYMATSKMISVPLNRSALVLRYFDENSKSLQENGHPKDVSEFLSERGETIATETFLSILGGVVSADKPMDEESGTNLYDVKDSGDSADKLVEHDDRVKAIRFIVEGLPRKEKHIIKGLYGIGCQPKSLNQCASEIGVTRERARQLAVKATSLMRNSKNGDFLKLYL